MTMRTLAVLLEKEFRQFFRNPFLPRMALMFPMMVMLVMMLALSVIMMVMFVMMLILSMVMMMRSVVMTALRADNLRKEFLLH